MSVKSNERKISMRKGSGNKQSKIDRKWWKEQIIYQIYPRSFKDTTGNGIGDLNGIIEKLDYIQSLGVTAVWINPIYASPNDDNGYDISDYRAILPEFGTMADFDALLAGLKKRNIKFIMDLVANHSSDEHPWFEASRRSRDNPYRDYYHWWPEEKGEPNFRWSYFDETGSAWKYDKPSKAYYLHYFSEKQPDLNWENPKVRKEIFDIMKYWAEKGVDGFRLDAFQFVSKDTCFPKLPQEYEQDKSQIIPYHGMGPNIHQYLREMNEQVLSQYSVFAVSEGAGSSFQDAHDLVDEERNELQVAYHFELVNLGTDVDKPHTLLEFKHLHNAWEDSFSEQGWLSVFLANHDLPRMVSKYGDDNPSYRAASAKLLNTYLLTSRGTPYCYYGDELGMTNINFENIDQYKDIAAINSHKKALVDGEDMDKFMRNLQAHSRDNSRTPMQWDSSEFAGFSDTTPWIDINPNKDVVNVACQGVAPDSVLNNFKALTKLRRKHQVLIYGAYECVMPQHEAIFAYTRQMDDVTILVILNFSRQQYSVDWENLLLQHSGKTRELLINNLPELIQQSGSLVLQAYQALVFKLA